MTFNELLLDAIKFDEVWMAYSVYWLIKNDVYKGTDNIKQVNWGLINEDEVNQMMERNDLNLNPVKLYTIPLGNDLHFLIFALTEESARGHCMNETGRLPEKIFDISQKMEMSFWFEDRQEYKSLRELKDETLIFPATAMAVSYTHLTLPTMAVV